MRLTRLEMYGFKSFSSKNELSFSPGITAFVGPNGCGKSNVVDAIRWVLGEQNPRSIRANKMEDIIFAGSEKSQHKNFAEVSIVLDNSDKEIPLDYQEVTVTRRLYRSGDSEYFLNRVPCRLKDVSEVLAATSLGRGSYAIIGQGQVEEVINSRPEDRRLMFEEAAGIALFKMRKKDAMKKLSDTRANLTRVDDILYELQGQEKDVRDSAELAQEYLGYKEKADKLELSLWAARFSDFNTKLEQLAKRQGELEGSRSNSSSLLKEREADLANATAKLQECSDVIVVLEKRKSDMAKERTELEFQLQLSEERQQDFANLVLSAKDQLAKLDHQVDEAKWEKGSAMGEIDSLQEKITVYSSALENRGKTAGLIRRLLAVAEKSRSDLDKRILEVMMDSTEAATNREKAIQTEAELTGKITSANKELENWQADIGGVNQEYNELEAKKASIQNQREKYLGQDRVVSDQIIQAQTIRDDHDSVVTQTHVKIQGATQKLEALKNMETELQGFSPGARAVLKAARNNKLSGIKGATAQLMQVKDPKNSLAIETALGAAVQYVICEDELACRRAIDMLKAQGQGRATFVPMTVAKDRGANRQNRFGQPIIGWADELVEFAPELRPVASMLLGNVLVAQNLAIATKLAKETNYRLKIVTLEGEVISRGLFTGGSSKSPGQGLIQRQAQVRQLEAQILDLQRELAKGEKELKAADEKLTALIETRNEVRGKLDSQDKDLVKLNIQLEQAELRKEKTKAKIEAWTQEISLLENELSQARDIILGLSSRISQEKAGLDNLHRAKEAIQGAEKEFRDTISLWASRQNSIQLTVYSLQNQLDNRNRQIKHLEQQLVELEARRLPVQEQIVKYETQTQELHTKLQDGRYALKEITQGLDAVAASLTGQVSAHNNVKAQMEELNRSANTLRQEIEQIDKSLHDAEVKAARWQAELESLERELGTRFGLDTQKGMENLDTRYTTAELSSSLKRIQNRLGEMGEVNLASISQHKKLTERLEFLTGQREDLLKAEADILGLVSELDGKIRDLFMETFTLVQGHFAEIFKTLFSGGNAYLSLSDQDNLLETGIEIFARPPGKKTQSLSLLSGGEKSMTAIALLFALQSVRPSPFCILDEIEAALDDVNIVRFADFVRKLSGDMQFILITHRRETMEHSDSLYGITLGPDGGSKPVSVEISSKKVVS